MDGKRLSGKAILLERELVKHRVVVMMGTVELRAEHSIAEDLCLT